MLLKYFSKKDWLLIALSVGLIVFQVWLDLLLPDYMAEITTLVQTNGSAMRDILIAGAKMIGCAFGSLAGAFAVVFIVARISANYSARVRDALFGKVQSFSLKEIGKFSTASLITRSTNDVSQVQNLIVMGLQILIKAPILAVWAIIKISNKNWQWTLATGISVAVLVCVVLTCMLIAVPKFKKIQKLTDNLNDVSRENITGTSVVRAYNAENFEEQKFKKANDNLSNTHLFAGNVMSFMMPSIQGIMSGLTLSIYWIGAVIISKTAGIEKLSIFSNMVVYLAYAMQILMAFMMLIMVFMMLPRSMVSVKRIKEVLKEENSIKNGNIKKLNNKLKGEIEFKNVSFCYPNAEEAVVSNISFSAHKGETVAIIGATGCGKSTIINLIPRFYDVSDGEVLVDGENVKNYDEKFLRSKIGYVSQKTILFTGTIGSNVAIGNMLSKDLQKDIEKSIKISQSGEFVNNLDKKFESYVSQGGKNFSGGQKQRLSIARAINKNPEIFIFDDSFSALDYKTDKKLRNELKQKCKNATKIIVAQRIGTVLDADKIIVLDGGKIVGNGKHSELLKTCDVYKEIALSQLSKEELK